MDQLNNKFNFYIKKSIINSLLNKLFEKTSIDSNSFTSFHTLLWQFILKIIFISALNTSVTLMGQLNMPLGLKASLKIIIIIYEYVNDIFDDRII